MTTYPDSVRFLYSLGNEIRTIKLGLDRIRALLERLGNPQRAFRSIHVAGTNGKGSVSAMVESGLRADGIRTGLYTSPHLIEPTERIRINGVPVTEEQFVWAFDAVHRRAEEMYQQGEVDTHPTYFETVTAMGFLLFRELGVQIAVVETGLGGRLDATNVLDPILCVITPVDYDHERYLGSSLGAIAGEKAGILKGGVPAVFAPQKPAALEALSTRARELSAPVKQSADWIVREVEIHRDGSRFQAVREDRILPIECPLAGEHQIQNAVTALSALLELGVSETSACSGLSQVSWPGRLEKVRDNPDIVLDGAHNPAGIRALTAYIDRFYADRKIWLVYGTMRDKSLDEIAGILSPVADHVILTNQDSRRALRAEVLEVLFDHASVHVAASVDAALAIAGEAAPGDAVFVTGSLLLVGDARKRLLP